jgi:y4mF family transcriptional regulator
MNHRDIGTAIRERRRLLGLTQARVAELAGVGRRTIGDLESGRGSRGATLTKVGDICAVLGLRLVVVDAGSSPDHD